MAAPHVAGGPPAARAGNGSAPRTDAAGPAARWPLRRATARSGQGSLLLILKARKSFGAGKGRRATLEGGPRAAPPAPAEVPLPTVAAAAEVDELQRRAAAGAGAAERAAAAAARRRAAAEGD
eukprot:gene11399-46698_t